VEAEIVEAAEVVVVVEVEVEVAADRHGAKPVPDRGVAR
jgi:hypothetical protein